MLAYLSGTADVRLTLGPVEEAAKELVCFTDASYAPYGRSFGAAVVVLAGCPLAWKAGRQSFVTLSVMESELYAATQGCTLLCSVYSLLNELFPDQYQKVLAIDNTSAVAMCQGGHGSQRTRHLKIRASYIRENVENGTLIIRHTPGEWQLADLATKAQPKLRLQRLMQLWGFVGFAANWVKELKLKLMMILVTIAHCICPARATEQPEKEPLPSTGLDELLLVCFVTSVLAVGVWELVRCGYRRYLRWTRRCKRNKKLEQVAKFAAEAAKQEIKKSATTNTVRSRRPPTPPIPTPPTTPRTSRPASSSMPMTSPSGMTPVTTERMPRARSSTTPTRADLPLASSPVQRAWRPPSPEDETREERMRVCYDVLMLMTTEELRDTLRQQGLPVSGLKANLAYKCRLTKIDISAKQRLSTWIARWKDA